MTQKSFLAQWDHLRQVVGIGLLAVEALPEDRLDSHPVPKMRTPKELAFHQFTMMRHVVEGLASGEVTEEDDSGAARLRSKAELVEFCHGCWTAADRAAKTVTDEKLAAMVKTPWGRSLPGVALAVITADEFLHHRGQMYAYLRAMGCDVPEMWNFSKSAPEFRPVAAANA